MLSQREEVLNHLKEYGSITSMEAFNNYGATRLSAIIFDLRHDGYDIKCNMHTGKTRTGRSCNYGVYTLEV